MQVDTREVSDMEIVAILCLVMGLLLVGVCVAAREQEQQRRTKDKGDAYRLRSDSTRR